MRPASSSTASRAGDEPKAVGTDGAARVWLVCIFGGEVALSVIAWMGNPITDCLSCGEAARQIPAALAGIAAYSTLLVLVCTRGIRRGVTCLTGACLGVHAFLVATLIANQIYCGICFLAGALCLMAAIICVARQQRRAEVALISLCTAAVAQLGIPVAFPDPPAHPVLEELRDEDFRHPPATVVVIVLEEDGRGAVEFRRETKQLLTSQFGRLLRIDFREASSFRSGEPGLVIVGASSSDAALLRSPGYSAISAAVIQRLAAR